MNILGVVLAAGRGRRMRATKALLRWRDETFLSHTTRALREPGVSKVIAVIGWDAERVHEEATRLGLETLLNGVHERGMLSSIVCAIDRAEEEGADAVIVHPVDHPRLDGATVRRLVDALEKGSRIVVPSFEGQRGHPAGFARSTWEALRAASPESGARAVLAEHPDWVTHVEGDPGCVGGVNTPEDYKALPA